MHVSVLNFDPLKKGADARGARDAIRDAPDAADGAPEGHSGAQVKTCLNFHPMLGRLAIWAIFLGCATPASAHELAVLEPFGIAVPLLTDLM